MQNIVITAALAGLALVAVLAGGTVTETKPVAASASVCKCDNCTCRLDEVNALKDKVAALERDLAQAREPIPVQSVIEAKPLPGVVCENGVCRVVNTVQSAHQPKAASPVAQGYYARQPVYGPFGRVRYYRTVWIRYASQGACGTCR